MAEKKKYTLLVRGKRIEVSFEVYKAYYKAYEQERYANDKALDMERSLDRFAEDGVNVEYQYAMSQPSLEDRVFREQMMKKLPAALDSLSDDERTLIEELFFKRKSERKLASQCGIPFMTIHDRKWRKDKASLCLFPKTYNKNQDVENPMKRITSILAALLLLLGATTTVSAANDHGDITGMAHDLSYGYSGDSDLGDVAPQDGLVEYIDLTDAMFTWEDGYVADDDGDADDGRQQRDHAMNFSGTFANLIVQADDNTDYIDISDGVEEAIILKTVGLSGSASTVTLGDGLGSYYVYSESGEYLGRGSDKLAYSDVYYLSAKELDLDEDLVEPNDRRTTPSRPILRAASPARLRAAAYPCPRRTRTTIPAPAWLRPISTTSNNRE